jgi:acetyltransferase-like isoleucine patch superfamily enzyme
MDLIARLLLGAASRGRILLYRAVGMRIRGHVSLRAIEFPRRPRTITLEAGAMLERGVVLLATCDAARIEIGRNCYLNRHTMIDASERVSIGDEAMVGPFCYITDHDHTINAKASAADGPLISQPTEIGARAWLGAHVTVLKGVTIGAGTVVGAGSVVTKSLPPGVVAVGNPARVLRQIAP